MRRVAKIEHEAVLKLCAMMHVNAGREVNPEHMKECNKHSEEPGRRVFELSWDITACCGGRDSDRG
jgi:hypothetical protein